MWNGSAWSELAGGVTGSVVNSLAVRPDGMLVVGGNFTHAGGIPSPNAAVWTGQNWLALTSPAGTILSLTVHPDGRVIAAGGSQPYVSSWDGYAWTPMGVLPGGGYATCVVATPPGEIYAGLSNNSGLARWTGAGWTAISGAQSSVAAMTAEPNGDVVVSQTGVVRRWNGTSWTPLASYAGMVRALYRDGSDLFVGGTFTTMGGIVSPFIARFGCPQIACYANCDGSTIPPVLNVADFACFLQKFASADPYANCDQSTTPPVLNVADFSCFLQKFAAGCQ